MFTNVLGQTPVYVTSSHSSYFLEGTPQVYVASCCRCHFLEKYRTNRFLEIQARGILYITFI